MINGRSVTSHISAGDNWLSARRDFLDSAARIEAANDLSINAGRDFLSAGGVLQSGRDTTIQAGRDLILGAAETIDSYNTGRSNGQTITQNGSTVTAGRDFSAVAGRDLSAIASQIDARRDINMSAVGDLTLMSAADEQHSYFTSKKVTAQEDHVSQVSTTLKAGGDIALSAGQDLALSASRLTAGDEAYLVAGGKLALLAAEDSDYSLYDMKKKGSFGAKKTQRDEITQVTNIGSEITTGGDLILESGGDQRYQVAKLSSGSDLVIDSGGDITFEAVKDLRQESHEKSKSDLAWNSAKGKGSTDETLRQSALMAQGDVVIKAVDGLKIDIKQIDQKTVSETIDVMVAADPQLAWLKEAEQRGDVDWRQVKELHDSFKYSHSGLGQGAMLVIIIIVTVLTAGAASTAIGSAAGATAGSSTAMAAAGPAVAGTATAAGATATGSIAAAGWANTALTAVATSAASGATISAINNRGNLGAVAKDVTSTDALRGYVVSGVTAALTAGVFDKWTGTQTDVGGALPNTGKVVAEGGLGTFEGVARFGANQLLQNGTSTALDRALGGNSQFDDALRTSLVNTFAAAGFNAIGDLYEGQPKSDTQRLTKIGLHAIMGGLAAEAAGGDFKIGALAAGLNETVVEKLAQQFKSMPEDQRERLLVMSSQLVGVLAAATAGGDAKDLETGAWAAANSTQYNYLSHQDVKELEQKARTCDTTDSCDALQTEARARSQANHEKLLSCDKVGNCAQLRAEIDGGSLALGKLESELPEGKASEILRPYIVIGGVNPTDWTLAGQLHLSDVAGRFVSNDPTWLKEASLYLDQTGFNPFGINVAGLAGLRGAVGNGVGSAKAAGGLAAEQTPTAAGRPLKPEFSPDAEAGMSYNHPVAGAGGAKGEVSGLLPKPGATSIPASGVGAGAVFKVDSKQLGKKLGKHVEDFGGNAASPADRKMVLDKIHDVGSNPEKVIPGTFAGQGANGARGDVFFRVKGNDVVVTKPDGKFVTILKDGVTQNPSVQSALKGGLR